MRRREPPILLAVLLALSPAAGQEPWGLSSYALEKEAARQLELPGRLREVSGLATTEDGRVFAHDDERARVYELDPSNGEVVRRIDVGPGGIPGDFEGIAVAGSRFFLVDSEGTLYEFAEGADKEDVPYTATPTGLGRRCEVEGLAYDALTDALLLACKNTRGRELRDRLVIFAVPLDSLVEEPELRYSVPYGSLSDVGAKGRLHPSGIEVHPVSGRIFIVAAQEEGIVELNRSGRFVGASELPHSLHRQPEGICFRAGELLLADEGGRSRATLTAYPHRDAPENAR